MIKKTIYMISLAGISLSSGISFAYPILYNVLGNATNINNSTNSELLIDSIDKTKFWVLPPFTGKVTPSNFSPSSNISYCKNILELQGQTTEVMNQINTVYSKIINAQSTILAKEEAYDALNREKNNFYSDNSVLALIKSKQDQAQSIEYNMTTYQSIYNAQCSEAPSQPVCLAQKNRIDSLQLSYDALNKEISDSINANKNIVDKYQDYQNKTSASYSDYTGYKNQFDGDLKTLNSLKDQIYSSYKYYSTLLGGTALINYDTGWQKNVATLTSENTGFNFEKIPTKNVSLYANAPGNYNIINYLSQLPSLLSYTIGNTKFYPFSANSPVSQDQLSDQIQANLDLSLVGSCPIENPTDYNIPKNEAGIPYFNIAVSYEYPLVYNEGFNFKYNLYKIYTGIKSSSDENYFDRGVYDTVLNDENSIQYNFPQTNFSSNSVDVIKKDVQAYILSKILKEMTYPALTNTNQAPVLENRYTGVLASKAENSTCVILNFACISDTWFLKDGSSVFGSVNNDAVLNSLYNNDVTESWALNSVYYMAGFTTFK